MPVISFNERDAHIQRIVSKCSTLHEIYKVPFLYYVSKHCTCRGEGGGRVQNIATFATLSTENMLT